jgi:phosphate-selective porin OprO and OprP
VRRFSNGTMVCLIAFIGYATITDAQSTAAMNVTFDGEHSHAAEAESTWTAQDSSAAKPGSVYDRIWKLTEWYRNDSNPVIQRLRFSGRYQHDYATVDADQGDHDEWNVRRMRMGLRANLFRSLTLHGEVDLNPQEAAPVYVRFTDLYLEWSTRPQLVVTIGKQSVPFTADGTTSSKELVAIDRSNLTNNIWFTEEYLPGMSVSGTAAPWAYLLGMYSAGAKNKELGEFSGGVATLGSLGYDFARSLSSKEALLTLNYVYQNPDPDNTFTKPYQHIVSLNLRLERDWWGLRSDLSTASGYFDQSNVWGVMVMPFINVTGQLQFVSRYTFLESRDPNGIELGTYEDRVVADRGDEYHDVYLGANYYFYGHQLKLQTGVQFADMEDLAADGGAYSGVSWVTGVRIGW